MRKSLTMIAMAVVLFTAAFMLFGCEGPQGPGGKDGKDGTNTGLLALEGFAPNARCGDCHTPGQDSLYFVAGRKYQWAQSRHALGGNSERNGASCAGCHTTEGFIQRMNGQTVTNQYQPSPPGCFACHSPHARAEFSLRKATAVTIGSNIAGVADALFDYGAGNVCVQCHQTRTMSPKMPGAPGPTDTVTITNERWYSHYGVQGQVLMGEGGFKFPGYTYRGNSNHSVNAAIKTKGCPTCHMVEQAYSPNLGTGKAGGHTMNIRYYTEEGALDTVYHLVSCNATGCHGANFFNETSYRNAIRPIEDSLHVLETLLTAKNWLTSSGTVRAGGTYGPLKITPAVKAGALYNFLLIEHDLSKGIHNTKYAQDLINSSIQALRTP
ncbi:MAG: hypothetical protein HY961_16290 [Ignavibacteriae bacterium]|nr:hypothetical protein [Ignavibacteriota bacterium]